jgi:hypothetical protein
MVIAKHVILILINNSKNQLQHWFKVEALKYPQLFFYIFLIQKALGSLPDCFPNTGHFAENSSM